jgi:hypothetical protein
MALASSAQAEAFDCDSGKTRVERGHEIQSWKRRLGDSGKDAPLYERRT